MWKNVTYGPWQRKFAWFPVILLKRCLVPRSMEDDLGIWLRWYERRWVTVYYKASDARGHWEYRDVQPPSTGIAGVGSWR